MKMNKFFFVIGILTVSAANADCDPFQAAGKFVQTNSEFRKWVGEEATLSNIRYSNIPMNHGDEKPVLIVLDYVNKYGAGTLSNMILIDKISCKAKAEWSAGLLNL